MSSDTLHSILSYAENLNLAEGEYLTVANALKTAFDNTPKSQNWTTFVTDNINDIMITLDDCFNNKTVHNHLKSVSASNIKEPGPTYIKFNIHTKIINNESGTIKEMDYCIQNEPNKSGKLYSLFKMMHPKKVSIKMGDIESDYECWDFLKTLKDNIREEHSINFPDEDEDDCDIYVDTDMFNHTTKKMFLDMCEKWFWEKYYEHQLA